MSKKIALLIGVSEYGEGITPLAAPPRDVAAMKRVLEHPQMGAFDEVKTLINPELMEMRKTILDFFKNAKKDDLVLLFFSGHGITDDDNKLYFTNRLTAKDNFEATAMEASFVQQQSKACYAKRQVMILDCCFSGAFAEGWQSKSVGLDIKRELGAEGRVVLTSSAATQTSFEQADSSLSLYTQYLVEGIETGAADKDKKGRIYVHELHDYAKSKVREVKPKMEPTIILDKEGFNILLSFAPVNVNLKNPVPSTTESGDCRPENLLIHTNKSLAPPRQTLMWVGGILGSIAVTISIMVGVRLIGGFSLMLPVDLLAYENKEVGIKFKYPRQSWDLQEIPNLITGEVARLMSRNQRATVLITVEKLDQPLSLADYTTRFIGQVEKIVDDPQKIERKDATLATRPAVSVTYTVKEDGGKMTKLREVWALKSNQAYVISYRGESGNDEELLSNFQMMVDSFEMD
jgi:hypothetical protein